MVGALLVHGLRLLELAYPMPQRLGTPLPPEPGARSRRDPVVLVGGFANAPEGWNEWRRSLEADGFEVYVLHLSTNGLGDMDHSTTELAAFVAEVKRRTGRTRVDIVGFSEGGLLARKYVAQQGGLGSVDRVISLATPHAGVPAGTLHAIAAALPLVRRAIPTAASQLVEGHQLLVDLERSDRALRAARGAGAAPRYASIYSRTIDLVVTPWSAWLPGALNIPVRDDRDDEHPGPSHFDMYHTSNRAYEAARALLLDRPDGVALHAGFGARELRST